MSSRNQFTIKGNLGSDPKVHTTSEDQSMVFLSVAVSNNYRDKETGEWVEKDPTWLDVTAFGHVSEKAEKLRKGNTVRVYGTLTHRKQEISTADGVKTYGAVGLRATSIEELR